MASHFSQLHIYSTSLISLVGCYTLANRPSNSLSDHSLLIHFGSLQLSAYLPDLDITTLHQSTCPILFFKHYSQRTDTTHFNNSSLLVRQTIAHHDLLMTFLLTKLVFQLPGSGCYGFPSPNNMTLSLLLGLAYGRTQSPSGSLSTPIAKTILRLCKVFIACK